MTTHSMAEKFGLGPIDQVSYAVRDLDEALARYGELFGPFETRQVELDDLIYRGRKARATLKLAFGRSGPIEIELVQPVAGDFPQAEYLGRHGEGLHHVRFLVPDLEAKVALMAPYGFSPVVVGHAAGVSFAYLEAPAFLGDSMVELLQQRA
jgi:catechol 2,3-dioxygenase-like lactoylglutathione lyase family enzyme